MSKKVVISLSVIFLVSCLASYRFGIYLSQKAYAKGLQETQAILSFNHMNRYEELVSCLENGKHAEAKGKLKQSIITQKELLASFLNSVESERVNEYISLRSKESLESLKKFESMRGSSWNDPPC